MTHSHILCLFVSYPYYVGTVFSVWNQVAQCCGFSGEFNKYYYYGFGIMLQVYTVM